MKYAFNNARNCLRIFLRHARITELWVPYELCAVVFKAARAEGVKLKFYHINERFEPVFEFGKDDYILYPNYFGICDGTARRLAQKYPNLIYDAAHSFFSEPLGAATIYSARKFFPVTDGGILITKSPVASNFPQEADLKDFSIDPFNFDYENFLKNELKFDRDSDIKLISAKSRRQLLEINFEKEKRERKENFLKLHEIFASVNELELPVDVVAPMVYPLKSRSDIAEKLINSGIFLIKYDYMKNIIPLPLKMAGDLPAIQKLFTNII